MRLFLILFTVLSACGSPATCKCGDGQACVFEGTTSRCATACGSDAGVCGASSSCGCASSCAGCKDCVLVCR